MLNKTCERCGKKFVLVPDPSCPMEWAVQLAKVVRFCQRCADYGWARQQLQDGVFRQCLVIRLTRNKTKLTAEDENTIRGASETIVRLCKAFVSACCKFYGKPYTWDDTFAESIIAKPSKAEVVFGIYERGIQAMSNASSWVAHTGT